MILAAAWWDWAGWLSVMVVTITLDALYCGLETGTYVLNKIRLDLRAEAGHRPAGYLQRLLHEPNKLLSILLIGTNVMRFASTFAITRMFMMLGAGAEAEIYTTFVATPVLFVVGDAIPKSAFRRLGDAAVYRLWWFLRISHVAFTLTLLGPIVRLFSGTMMRLAGASANEEQQSLEDEAVAQAVAEGRASGTVTHFQSIMADRIMHLDRVRLSQVMVPMHDVVRAPLDVDSEALTELYRSHEVSRVPLLDGSGRVAGVLNVHEALVDPPEGGPTRAAVEPLVLPENTSVTGALYRMQREKTNFAVVSRGRRHIGIVTVKDLVEEIVGEIQEW